jgi:hypothetical protein
MCGRSTRAFKSQALARLEVKPSLSGDEAENPDAEIKQPEACDDDLDAFVVEDSPPPKKKAKAKKAAAGKGKGARLVGKLRDISNVGLFSSAPCSVEACLRCPWRVRFLDRLTTAAQLVISPRPDLLGTRR